MPIYTYECRACGPFTAMQPMARFQAPCSCPGCDVPAPRTISGAPAIGASTAHHRLSGPGAAAAETGRGSSTAHGAGCGCCMRRMGLPGALATGGRVFASHGPVQPCGLN